MHVHAAAYVGAHDYARLQVNKGQRVSPARADYRKRFQRTLLNCLTEISRAARLYRLGRSSALG